MCFATIISTTSEQDLSELDSPSLNFSSQIPSIEEVQFLRYPNKWHVKADESCSCGFRHLDRGMEEFGFSPPQDWLPEEPEEIKATLRLVTVLKGLLESGVKLDCIDVWQRDDKNEPKLTNDINVNLSSMPEQSFRFIENYRFEFSP
jgi:hypothetical protein